MLYSLHVHILSLLSFVFLLLVIVILEHHPSAGRKYNPTLEILKPQKRIFFSSLFSGRQKSGDYKVATG
jgi:hypothetical protein